MPSLFKTLGAVVCLVFALSFAAPNAAADEFVYTYTVIEPAGFGATFTTNPIAAVTAPTAILAADLASFSLTGSAYQGSTLVSLLLNNGGAGGQVIILDNNVAILNDAYALSDYSTPGTHTGGFSTLTVTSVTATPEPSSVALMLSGVGLVFAMRKRKGLSQAS